MKYQFTSREVFASNRVIGHIVQIRSVSNSGATIESRILRNADAEDFLQGVALCKDEESIQWLMGGMIGVGAY